MVYPQPKPPCAKQATQKLLTTEVCMEGLLPRTEAGRLQRGPCHRGHRLQQNRNETGDAKRVQPPLPMHAGCAKRRHPKKPPPRLRRRWGFRATWYVRATRGVAPRYKLKPSALKELWNTIGSDNTPGQVHRFVKGPRTNLEGSSSRVIGPTDELGR